MRIKLNNFPFLVFVFLLITGCASEKKDWERTKSENTIPAYEDFLNRYSQGPMAEKARLMIDSLSVTKNYKGLKITVLSIEKVSVGSIWTCPPGIAGMNFKTSTDQPLTLVRLKLTVMPSYKKVKVTRVELFDTEGNKYENHTPFRDDLGSPIEYKCGLFFTVPSGVKLKTFQFEDLSFDLEYLNNRKLIK